MADEFTLADYERTAPDNLSKAVVRTWREASPIMDMLNFRVSSNLSERVLRFNGLNNVTWRKIGEDFVQSKVEPDSVEERLYFMGAKVDVPYEYVKASSLIDLRAAQTEAVMKSIAFGFNDAFFNNTPTTDEDAIVGMWYRIINDLGSAQYRDAGLDISPDTAVTSWQHKTFDELDAVLDLVDGNPSDKVIFVGMTMYRRLQAAFRSSSLLATTKDQLGRQFITYGEGGPKLIQAGYKYDGTTQILTDVATGITSLTGSTDSLLFVCRFGAPFIEGWCQEMPSVEDVGLLESRVNYRTVVRFSPGIFMTHPRSAALSYNWTAA